MKLAFPASLILILSLFFPSFDAHGSVPPLDQVDALYRDRQTPALALKALEGYRSLAQAHPESADAEWRLSMACYFVGLRLSPNTQERVKLYDEGVSAGRKAIALNTNCAECHFWTAINMALYGDAIGVFKMLFSLSEIREHLAKSQLLDPTYAFSGADRLLGVIDEKLPGILGGSDERARSHFERAIQRSPDEPLNYVFLAKLLLKDQDTRIQGIGLLKKAALLPAPSAERIESREALQEAKSLLSSELDKNQAEP